MGPLLTRFRSDADLGGTEKVSITQVSKEFLESGYEQLKPLHSGPLTAEHVTTRVHVKKSDKWHMNTS